VYLAFFTLFMAASAWGAWHNNPMYSNRTTIRYIVVVTLAVAALVGAVIGTVQLVGSSPPPIAFGSMAAVCLAGTIAMIWLIMKLSTPRAILLPPGTPLVRVHRAALAPWIRRFAWTLLVLAILAVALPGNGKDIVYAVGGLVVFLGIVLLFSAYVAALDADRSLTSVEMDPWIHWRYSPPQWKAWTEAEVDRAAATPAQWIWSRDWKRLAFPLLVITVGVYISQPQAWLWDTGYTVFVWVLFAALIALANRNGATLARRVRRVLSNAAPESYFGAAGVFSDGVYTQWQTVGNYLLEATMDERPPRSISLVFEKIGVGAAASASVRQSVPVPADADGDITRLQAALSARCPTAQIALS
jgi:hypothetical protein